MASDDDGSTGERLAKVTYLPGVFAPSSPPPLPSSPDAPSLEATLPEATLPEATLQEEALPETALPIAEAADFPLPRFETFFGAEDALDINREPRAEVVAHVDHVEDVDDSTTTRKREVRAENVSMHALARRGMSRWELEKTLTARELDEETVTAELDRLEGVGLLDDAALAENFVRTQHERKGLGRGAITAELRRRHVDQEHIDAALEQVDDDDEQVRATELAVKRAGQLSSYDLETAKRRLNGFLMRKGYSSSVVRAAIDEALGDRSGSGSGSRSPRSGGSSGVRFR